MSEKSDSNHTCDVCGATYSISTLSSGIAPVTYEICPQCEKLKAESIGVVSVWLAYYGALELAPEFRMKLVSHIDGNYVGWEDIRRYY